MRRLNSEYNRIKFATVYDTEGQVLGEAWHVINHDWIRIYLSQVKYWDETKRGIEWVECPICGLRCRQLSQHYKKSHPNEKVPEVSRAKMSNFSFETFWKVYNPTLSEAEAKEQFTKFRETHGMNKGWGVCEANHNHSSNSTEYSRKSKSPRCIEFWLAKGFSEEEAIIKRNDWYKKLYENMSFNTRVDFYLSAAGGDYEKAKQMLAKRQHTNKPDKYIERYGLELGLEKYTEKLKRWANKLKESYTHGSSKIELSFINDIMDTLSLAPEKCQFRGCYKTIRPCGFLPDFIYNNEFVIEFYGDYWHANPKLYTDDNYVTKHGKYVKEVHDKDALRNNLLHEHGYKVLVVWEHDYRTNRELVINDIAKFLQV